MQFDSNAQNNPSRSSICCNEWTTSSSTNL